jgi:nuclear pore complex protein Nup155
MRVEEIGHRTNQNENVFPVNIILQLLLQYDIEFYTHETSQRNLSAGSAQDLAPNANLQWPIEVFTKLNSPFEYLVATLEGRNRKLLVKWIIFLVEEWAASSRRSGALFGGPENAIGLADLLRVVLGSDVLGREVDDQAWIQRAREIAATVDEAAR